jgi:hypothetical protein
VIGRPKTSAGAFRQEAHTDASALKALDLVGAVIQSTTRGADTFNGKPCDRARQTSLGIFCRSVSLKKVSLWGSGSRSLPG